MWLDEQKAIAFLHCDSQMRCIRFLPTCQPLVRNSAVIRSGVALPGILTTKGDRS